jgi:hypothetical protein
MERGRDVCEHRRCCTIFPAFKRGTAAASAASDAETAAAVAPASPTKATPATKTATKTTTSTTATNSFRVFCWLPDSGFPPVYICTDEPQHGVKLRIPRYTAVLLPRQRLYHSAHRYKV